MSLIIKIICPEGIITGTDSREVYSMIDLKSSKKIYTGHIDNVPKSFLKKNLSIAICGNANIGKTKIKDFFQDFLNQLDDDIEYDSLIGEIINLYDAEMNYKTKYFISFYDKISPTSKYRFYYKFEPFLYCLDTTEMKIERMNEDEDGFTHGIYWGGENDRISISLKEKRSHIDTNKLTIKSSIDLIISVFQEVQDNFIENKEYQTVSRQIDLTVQKIDSNEIIRNYITI